MHVRSEMNLKKEVFTVISKVVKTMKCVVNLKIEMHMLQLKK